LPAHAKSTEICRRSLFNPQLVQFGAKPLQQTEFQTEPSRRSRRVASTLRRIKGSVTVQGETSSNPSDSNHSPDPSKHFKTNREIIRLSVMLYLPLPPSRRNVEDLPHVPGIDVSHEAMRKHGRPEVVVTDRPRSYSAANRRETGRSLNTPPNKGAVHE
ncbi:MAG: hypothetical protein RLQ73_00335, partial [Hoeflea sp. D1-CHI-28]